jgi:hypothetical protein
VARLAPPAISAVVMSEGLMRPGAEAAADGRSSSATGGVLSMPSADVAHEA